MSEKTYLVRKKEKSSEELYIRGGLIKLIRGGLRKTYPALISDHLLRRAESLIQR